MADPFPSSSLFPASWPPTSPAPSAPESSSSQPPESSGSPSYMSSSSFTLPSYIPLTTSTVNPTQSTFQQSTRSNPPFSLLPSTGSTSSSPFFTSTVLPVVSMAPPSTRHTPTFPASAIAGAAAGGAAFIALICLSVCYYRRAARRRLPRRDEIDRSGEDTLDPILHEFETSTAQLDASDSATVLDMSNPSPFCFEQVVDSEDRRAAIHQTSCTNFSIAPTVGGEVDAGLLRIRGVAQREGNNEKATAEREKLSHQIRDIEQHVTKLRSRTPTLRSVSRGSTISAGVTDEPIPSLPTTDGQASQPTLAYDDSEIRRQVEVLQQEVARLRVLEVAWQTTAVGSEAPPAYDGGEEETPLPRTTS